MDIASHVPHFATAWRWTRGKRLAMLAGFFAAMEFIVTCGVKLPYSDDIPQPLRLAGIGLIIFLRYYLGWRADRDGRRG